MGCCLRTLVLRWACWPAMQASYGWIDWCRKMESLGFQYSSYSGYDPQKHQTNTLDRKTQTTLLHLSTGHWGLGKHLKTLGLADSAHCMWLWGANSWVHSSHLPAPGDSTSTVWPEDTEVGTKPLGQAAQLQQTVDFLAAISLRI